MPGIQLFIKSRGAKRISISKKLSLVSMTEELNRCDVEELVWFAMSATFGRSLKAKTFLESKDVRCFVPMRYEIVKDRRQIKKKKLVPVINNLIFVYTTKERIQTLKANLEYLQYMTHPCDGKNIPIIVPENQMRQFIDVCKTYNDKLMYVSPSEVDLKEGVRVRVVGGTFDGIEGTFLRVKGERNKRVVVIIPDLLAVAVEVKVDLMEIIS